ncbi:hypothetical protein [Sporomusa aerivorans]|uniref:hypothetical protein n=1 Tax=Sporomusa aerivorans TaxID=204936 RepID=UPI00352A620D
MKKVIMSVLASLAFASTAFAAAPGMDVAAGQTQLGYSYNHLDTNAEGLGELGSFNANSFQAAYGLSDKFALTGDYLDSQSKSYYYGGGYSLDDLNYNTSQIGLQYKLNKNLALSVGNVRSEVNATDNNYAVSASTNEMFGGVAYKAAINNNMDGYASYIRSSNVQDGKVGMNYRLNDNASVDLGYRYFENDGLGIKAKGANVGVNYKF